MSQTPGGKAGLVSIVPSLRLAMAFSFLATSSAPGCPWELLVPPSISLGPSERSSRDFNNAFAGILDASLSNPHHALQSARVYGDFPHQLGEKPLDYSPREITDFRAAVRTAHRQMTTSRAMRDTPPLLLKITAVWKAELELARAAEKRADQTGDAMARQQALDRYASLMRRIAEYSSVGVADLNLSRDFEAMLVNTMRNATTGWLKANGVPFQEKRVTIGDKEVGAIVITETKGTPLEELAKVVRSLDRAKPRQIVVVPGGWQGQDRMTFKIPDAHFQLNPTFLSGFSLGDLNLVSQLRRLEAKKIADRGAITPFAGVVAASDIMKMKEGEREKYAVRLVDFSQGFAVAEQLKKDFAGAKTERERLLHAKRMEAVLAGFDAEFLKYVAMSPYLARGLNELADYGSEGSPLAIRLASTPTPGKTPVTHAEVLPFKDHIERTDSPPWTLVIAPYESEGASKPMLMLKTPQATLVLPVDSKDMTRDMRGFLRFAQVQSLAPGAKSLDRGSSVGDLVGAVAEQLNHFQQELGTTGPKIHAILGTAADYGAKPGPQTLHALEAALDGFRDPGLMGMRLDAPTEKPSTVARTRPEDAGLIPGTLQKKMGGGGQYLGAGCRSQSGPRKPKRRSGWGIFSETGLEGDECFEGEGGVRYFGSKPGWKTKALCRSEGTCGQGRIYFDDAGGSPIPQPESGECRGGARPRRLARQRRPSPATPHRKAAHRRRWRMGRAEKHHHGSLSGFRAAQHSPAFEVRDGIISRPLRFPGPAQKSQSTFPRLAFWYSCSAGSDETSRECDVRRT